MTRSQRLWIAEAAIRFDAVVIIVTGYAGIQALLMPRALGRRPS